MIYADVLITINYFISYALLCGCSRIAGVPLHRRGKLRGALAGAASSMAVFLPFEGIIFGVLLRFVSAVAMLWSAWPGQKMDDYIRLGVVLLGVVYFFAGCVVGICMLWPSLPIECPAGMFYFEVNPLVLLLAVVGSYFLLTLIKRFYSAKKSCELIYTAKILRNGREEELHLFKDTGNRLTEPFSGLPVAVCCLESIHSLLSLKEKNWFEEGMPPENMPLGFRFVAYHSVGRQGMMAAFRPEKLGLFVSNEIIGCDAFVAVTMEKMPGCDGIFNPAMLELRI